MTAIHLTVTYGPMDPECMKCGRPIEVRGVLMLDRDDPVCPGCVPAHVAQAATGLQHVYDAVTLDGGAQLAEIAAGLRILADLADRIANGQATVTKRIELVHVPWEPLVGIALDWTITDGR